MGQATGEPCDWRNEGELKDDTTRRSKDEEREVEELSERRYNHSMEMRSMVKPEFVSSEQLSLSRLRSLPATESHRVRR